MKNLIVANWKMNPDDSADAREIASRIEHTLLGAGSENVEVVICPPFVFLPAVRHAIHYIKLGAQDLSSEQERSAFTGEVSAGQLYSFNCQYVIVGHSERREMGEKDALINKKLLAALQQGIIPILCVGHGVKKGAAAATITRTIKKQLTRGLKGLSSEDLAGVVVAYEPVWAIGSSKPATPAHVKEITEYIEEQIPGVRVIYGGSINSSNAQNFARLGIRGALVGGGSLHAVEFISIVKSFSF